MKLSSKTSRIARFAFGQLGVISLIAVSIPSLHAQPSSPRFYVALTKVQYLGFEAYRLTNGRTEAVIVPALGRVMRYALVGGENQLWNSKVSATKAGQWSNWGGDKSWPAPQSQWPLSIGHEWPPHTSWDGKPYMTTLLPNKRLRIVSGVWPRLGCRVIREFSFDANGEFVIAQTYEKMSGPPCQIAIWNITQVGTPQAIFVEASPDSAYKGGFHWLTKPKDRHNVSFVGTSLLRIEPNSREMFKIGVDSPIACVGVVNDRVAFVQRAARPKGRYPDGAEGNGFPVEIFDIGGTGNGHYMETELLSPLRSFYVGTRWTHSVRWKLVALNKQDEASDFTNEIRVLLDSAD